MHNNPYRQIHLDFHTSGLIGDVGSEFNAQEFAQTLSDAHVQSINIFAKCHHGWAYYPSKVGPMHPSLTFDLLGQMIEALHTKGIRCPVYTSVCWDEIAAEAHPEWIQIDHTGKRIGREPFTSEPTGWSWLCLNSGYLDYLCKQVDELLDYDPDGLWFDILLYTEDGCSCNNCVKEMKDKGYNPSDVNDRRKQLHEVLRRSMKRLSDQVWGRLPEASIYFNGRARIDENDFYGMRPEQVYFSHLEIESLPSGRWGYNHFPMFVRYERTLNPDIVGMNGRFHKSWADFGGIKNKAALEYECFQMLANGAKVCIGDQLHPRGRLDSATYGLIGEVFAQIRDREPWVEASKPFAEIGLMCVNEGTYARGCHPVITTLEAAAQLLLEDGAQFDIVDWKSPLEAYRLLILPDRVRLDDERLTRLEEYLNSGGKLLMTGESGLYMDRDDFALEMGLTCSGRSEYTCTYMRLDDRLKKGLLNADYVSYERGINAVPEEADVLGWVVHPYFERAWEHFMSHQQTPPKELSNYAFAALYKDRILYISDPVFSAYKQHGALQYKKLISNAIDLLLVERLVSGDLPSTARITVCDQPNRRIVHLLHYPVERRSTIDIVEDVIPLYNRTIRVAYAQQPEVVTLEPSGKLASFTWKDGYVQIAIPEIIGHQMVAIQ